MPHSSGKKNYTQSEKRRIQKEVAGSKKVPGVNDSQYRRAIAKGNFMPRSTPSAEQLRLAKRAAVDAAITGRAPKRAKPKQPAQPQQPPTTVKPPPSGGVGESIREGFGLGGLIGALTPKPPKPKKNGRRR